MPLLKRQPALLISLDFELHRGVRDARKLDARERARLQSARQVIPHLLRLFTEFQIHATWATVGLLVTELYNTAQRNTPSMQTSVANTLSPAVTNTGLSLRQAALTAGFAYLLNPVTYAEFSLMPKLVSSSIEQTVQNIAAHQQLFALAIVCYLLCFIGDIVIAWALYILLAPVNRALSLLAAWFQLVYTAMALAATLNLLSVFRLVTAPEYLTLFGPGPFHAQVKLLLGSFRWGWSMSLVVFGLHLVLLGYLIYRSRYIPRIIGILLVINGVGWWIDSLQAYLFPNAKLGFLFITFFGEIIFMLWLLIRGWKVQPPSQGK